MVSSAGVATWYYNNTLQSQNYSISNKGNYIGIQADGGGIVNYFDNILIQRNT